MCVYTYCTYIVHDNLDILIVLDYSLLCKEMRNDPKIKKSQFFQHLYLFSLAKPLMFQTFSFLLPKIIQSSNITSVPVREIFPKYNSGL